MQLEESDRAANVAARFLPQRDDDESPAIDLAGALVIAHVRDGGLHVNLSLDTPDPAAYRLYGGGLIPVEVSVGGDTVYESLPGPLSPAARTGPRRFELSEPAARALIARALRRYLGPRHQPGQARGEDLCLEPGWNPRVSHCDEAHLAEYLIGQAVTVGAIRCPQGIELDLHCCHDGDGGMYAWRVRTAPGFTLGSDYWREIRRWLGTGNVGAHGALSVLRQAVTAANDILDAYERAALRAAA